MNTADSGMSTIRLKYAIVQPMLSPKPGSTRFPSAARGLPSRGRRIGADRSWNGGIAIHCERYHSVTTHLPLRAGLVDLVEGAAVGKMRLLRRLPVAEIFLQRKQRQLRELLVVLLRHRIECGPVEIPGRDFLAFGRVQVFEIGLRDLARALLSTTRSISATGGSASMLYDGTTISTLSGPSSLTAR